MVRTRLLLLTGVLLLLPFPALAERSMEWSFLGGNVDGTWEASGLEGVEARAEGVQINTPKDGYMMRETKDLDFPIDVVTVRLAGTHPGDVKLIWTPRSSPGQIYQRVFRIEGTGVDETFMFSMAQTPGWDPDVTGIGLAFPAGTDMMLRSMTVQHWNGYEKLFEGFKSFWSFDQQWVYSINFLWGPLLTTNPVARSIMFDTLPPLGRSGVWVFYAILAAATVGAVLWHTSGDGAARTKSGLRKSMVLFLATAAGCWLLFDARMSAEYWSYVARDVQTYLLKIPGERTFRNYQTVPDMVAYTVSGLDEDEMFVFINGLPEGGGLIKYYGYPHLTLTPENAPPGTRAWLVFRSPDLRVDESGMLRRGTGTGALAGPGTVVQQFDPTSFLFVLNP